MSKELINRQAIELSLKKANDFSGTYKDIFNTENYISFKTTIKHVGEEETKRMLFLLIAAQIKDAFKIDPVVLKGMIDYFVRDYPESTFNDISLFFKNVKFGKYGKVFEYDMPTLGILFEQYQDHRWEAFEEINKEKNAQFKQDAKQTNPIIINKFADEVKANNITYKGAYTGIDMYCEFHGIDQSLFDKAYEFIYNELDDQAEALTQMTLAEFIKHMKAKFMVFQNSVRTTPNINKNVLLENLVLMCNNYMIPEMISLCKEFGMWMIPTEFYFAAKHILINGGIIKLRYDLDAGYAKVINDFINKILDDGEIKTPTKLFLIGMCFNFTLNIGRFNRSNNIE